MEKSSESLSQNTLFVRGIPHSCSNETLSEVFSKAGAIKDCFVVKYKNSESNKPCIGYVTYTLVEDARSALRMEKEFVIDGNKLKISAARRKLSKKEKKRKEKDFAEKEVKSDNVEENIVIHENKDDSLSSRALDDDSYTVLIGGLPALYKREHVLTMWKKSGLKEPKELIFPCENIEEQEDLAKQSEASKLEAKKLLQHAKFVVETKQAALKAYNKLSGKVVGKKNNYTLKVTFLTPEGNFKAARKSRLIVRNLSFQCSEDDLKKTFCKFGTVTEVKIPTKPDGRKRGFAFVQFTHVFETSRAIKAMNMQEIKGRKVAIDWSLPKEKYKEFNASGVKDTEQEADSKDRELQLSKDTEDKDDESASEEEAMADSGVENEESESNKETSDEESEIDTEASDEESGEEQDEEENPYSKPLGKASKIVKKLDPKSSHDVHEGRTVFVLNLSYDTTEDTLAEALTEYGELSYTKIVINHDTGMSKGCGFAQFKTPDEAKQCMAALGEGNSSKTVDGRQIKAVPALSRGDSDKMKKEGKKKMEKEDKKNLHLGREGLVRPGTSAAEGLSEIELKKREKIENAKRAKLKNPNVFVSTTRLCVHNLPKFVDDQKLKEILLSQFKDSSRVRVTECRIMRDRNNLNERGIGRPLGYAFVDFAKHENALRALRSLNNNPDTFGPIKRPIVEFALENKKALEIKEQRKKKFLARKKLNQNLRSNEESTGAKPEQKTKKMGRRQKQQLKRKLDSGEGSEIGEKRKKLPAELGSNKSFEKLKAGKRVSENGEKRPKFKSNSLHEKDQNPRKKGKFESGHQDSQNQRKPYQGSTGTTLSGKKLPLPAHSKPKIRQKNKGKILEQMRRSKKLNSKSAQQKLVQKFERQKSSGDGKFVKNLSKKKENPKRKPAKRKSVSKEDAKFNALVAKYTKAIMDKSVRKTGDKWYE